MSLKKQYFKKKGSCKVTFDLPKQIANSAATVHLVGDFNEWDLTGTPMKKRKDGSFSATVELKADREYAFRYLIDGSNWENDPEADRTVPNEYGSQNSVVVLSS
jgi:1,4-alpha-glucan branching enzyme